MRELVERYFPSIGVLVIIGLLTVQDFWTHTRDTEHELRREITRLTARVDMLEEGQGKQNVLLGRLEQLLETVHADYERLRDLLLELIREGRTPTQQPPP